MTLSEIDSHTTLEDVDPNSLLGLRVSRALSIALLAFGAFTFCFSTWMIIQTYSPYPFWDHWNIIGELLRNHNRITIHSLWAQHNEHRILLGRLLCYADLFFLGGRNIGLLAVIWISQLALLAILTLVVRRWSALSGPVQLALIGLAIYNCFSPLQTENLVWAFQAMFVPAPVAACYSFAALLWAAQRNGSLQRRKQNVGIAASILFALFSEATVANGLTTWPLLIVLAVFLKFNWKQIAALGITAGIAVFLYLQHYHSPVGHSRPTDSLQHPWLVFKFMLTELAGSWTAYLPNPSNWPVAAEWLALFAMLLPFSAVLFFIWQKQQPNRFVLFLLTVQLFCLGAVLMTALGRLRFGNDQALAGRYQCFVLLFWWCSISLVMQLLQTFRWLRQSVIPIQAACLIMVLGVGSRYQYEWSWAKGHQEGLARAWAALAHHSTNNSALMGVFYDPEQLRSDFAYMQAEHWGPPAGNGELGYLEAASINPKLTGFTESTSDSCNGFMDASENLSAPNDFKVSGWAWDKASQKPAKEIAIISSSGKIFTTTTDRVARPDVVSATHSAVSNEMAGWAATLHNIPPGTYRAYAILNSGKQACPLQQQLVVRAAR